MIKSKKLYKQIFMLPIFWIICYASDNNQLHYAHSSLCFIGGCPDLTKKEKNEFDYQNLSQKTRSISLKKRITPNQKTIQQNVVSESTPRIQLQNPFIPHTTANHKLHKVTKEDIAMIQDEYYKNLGNNHRDVYIKNTNECVASCSKSSYNGKILSDEAKTTDSKLKTMRSMPDNKFFEHCKEVTMVNLDDDDSINCSNKRIKLISKVNKNEITTKKIDDLFRRSFEHVPHQNETAAQRTITDNTFSNKISHTDKNDSKPTFFRPWESKDSFYQTNTMPQQKTKEQNDLLLNSDNKQEQSMQFFSVDSSSQWADSDNYEETETKVFRQDTD